MESIAEETKHVTGPVAHARRLGRPEPVDGAGRRRRDPGGARTQARLSRPKGRTVVVSGLGPRRAARWRSCCAKAGAKLVVADIDRSKQRAGRAARRALGRRRPRRSREGRRARPVRAGRRARSRDGPALQVPVVAGAANNQLADDAVADLLAERGHPLGARLRRQRRRDHQHLGRARPRRLRPRPRPRARQGHRRHAAPHLRPRRGTATRRSARRSRWPAPRPRP